MKFEYNCVFWLLFGETFGVFQIQKRLKIYYFEIFTLVRTGTRINVLFRKLKL